MKAIMSSLSTARLSGSGGMLSGIVCQLPRQRQPFEVGIEDEASRMLRFYCQASVPRDVFPPTPPGPEGSNGNGLLRVQWVAGAWLISRGIAHRGSPVFSAWTLPDRWLE